jgi:hypothetical protein
MITPSATSHSTGENLLADSGLPLFFDVENLQSIPVGRPAAAKNEEQVDV